MSELATLTVEQREGATVARLVGELDMSNAEAIRERLLEAGGGGPLVLDLSGVEYLDSAWLAAMDRLAQAIPDERGGLRLVCPSAAPGRRALEVTGVDQILPLHDSVDAALGSGDEPEARRR